MGALLMATLDDPEETLDTTNNGASDAKWKWEKSQDMSSWTAVDSSDLRTRTRDTTTVGYYLRATATYDDSFGNGKTAQAVSVNKVRAAPTTAPATAMFPSGSDMRDVDENSPAGTNVGDPVKANDTSDDVLTYSLAGAGGFQINPATGQITVGPRTVLDTETKDIYMVTVTVTEAGGGTVDSPLVTITVNDVNEAPMLTTGATMVEVSENYDVAIAVSPAYTATDPEEGTVVLSLEGADAGKFNIDTATAGMPHVHLQGCAQLRDVCGRGQE